MRSYIRLTPFSANHMFVSRLKIFATHCKHYSWRLRTEVIPGQVTFANKQRIFDPVLHLIFDLSLSCEPVTGVVSVENRACGCKSLQQEGAETFCEVEALHLKERRSGAEISSGYLCTKGVQDGARYPERPDTFREQS